jgi:hypothetical protein
MFANGNDLHFVGRFDKEMYLDLACHSRNAGVYDIFPKWK